MVDAPASRGEQPLFSRFSAASASEEIKGPSCHHLPSETIEICRCQRLSQELLIAVGQVLADLLPQPETAQKGGDPKRSEEIPKSNPGMGPSCCVRQVLRSGPCCLTRRSHGVAVVAVITATGLYQLRQLLALGMARQVTVIAWEGDQRLLGHAVPSIKPYR